MKRPLPFYPFFISLHKEPRKLTDTFVYLALAN